MIFPTMNFVKSNSWNFEILMFCTIRLQRYMDKKNGLVIISHLLCYYYVHVFSFNVFSIIIIIIIIIIRTQINGTINMYKKYVISVL